MPATDPHSFPSNNQRIFVTGGTGFLGAYIVQNLVQKGFAVRALRRSNKTPFFISQEIWQQVEWIEGDVLDLVSLDEAMENCSGVIHSAAVVSFSSKERQQMYDVNIEGTKNVVNIALEKNIRRLVHVSSVAALGRTQKEEMVTEERKWEESQNTTHYSITKHHAEMEVWRAFAEGLEGVIVNPSTILGFGNWHQSSCAIFKNVYKQFPWYTEGINGFVGVEDAAEAIVQLYLSPITEKRFILNADNWSFKKLFETIALGFHKKPPYRKASPLLGSIAWRLEGLKNLFTDGKPLLTKESARVAHSKTQFDNSALLRALPGFSFSPLEEVIQSACKNYLQQLQQNQLAP